jgi:hypothetical protein
MRGKYDDLIEVLAGVFSRHERIGLWLLSGVSVGMMKAGGWMLEGVPQNVALAFGAFYALDVLMIVGFGYHFITSSIQIWPRLWARRREGQGQ